MQTRKHDSVSHFRRRVISVDGWRATAAAAADAAVSVDVNCLSLPSRWFYGVRGGSVTTDWLIVFSYACLNSARIFFFSHQRFLTQDADRRCFRFAYVVRVCVCVC